MGCLLKSVLFVGILFLGALLAIYIRNVNRTRQFSPHLATEEEKAEFMYRAMKDDYRQYKGYYNYMADIRPGDIADAILGIGDTRHEKYNEYRRQKYILDSRPGTEFKMPLGGSRKSR